MAQVVALEFKVREQQTQVDQVQQVKVMLVVMRLVAFLGVAVQVVVLEQQGQVAVQVVQEHQIHYQALL